MSIPVVICDDSSFARKQVARALPKGWDIDISFATNGVEGLQAIREGKGDILFLDLTMPELDGFGVLEAIRREDLPTLTIVISGDIQPESQKRVKALGAITFIKKPVNATELTAILDDYGLIDVLNNEDQIDQSALDSEPNNAFADWCQEISNVAMGRAADLLAHFIRDEVVLSIPDVHILNQQELKERLKPSTEGGVSHFSCGFIGSGIYGENLIFFHDINFRELGKLMNYQKTPSLNEEREILMDISNILVGSFLHELSELLHTPFSQGHPRFENLNQGDQQIISQSFADDARFLAIKINYAIGGDKLQCDQMVLLPNNAITALEKLSYYTVMGEVES